MNDLCYLSRPTYVQVSTLCKSSTMLWSSNPQAPPTQNRCLTRFALSLSLCSALLCSAQAGLVRLWAFSSQLLMVETKTRMNIDRGSWLQIQSAALKVNDKNQSKWKSTKNKMKMNTKSLQQFCNNYLLHKNDKTCCKLTTTKTKWNS